VHFGALNASVQACAAHAYFLRLIDLDALLTFWCCIAVNSRLLSESGGPCVCSEETRADPDCVFYDGEYDICVEMFRRELVTVDVFAMWSPCESVCGKVTSVWDRTGKTWVVSKYSSMRGRENLCGHDGFNCKFLHCVLCIRWLPSLPSSVASSWARKIPFLQNTRRW